MIKPSARFIENLHCKYYPCHKGILYLNCLFCFCPLFNTDKCQSTGEKYDCMNCTFPHNARNYGKIIKLLTPNTCYDFYKCQVENCDVKKLKKGDKCWTVASEFCKNGKTRKACKVCKFYILKHPHKEKKNESN